MSFSIDDWNMNPNQLWFIRFDDNGSTFGVKVFVSQTDAEGDTNEYATATGLIFGTTNEVIFTVIAGDIEYFNDQLAYHIKASGEDGDATQIFQVSPFIDLDDITNSIYRTEELIQSRAIDEINLHTHIKINRDVGIANHIPSLKVGDVCAIISTRLDLDVLTDIEEVVIIGTVNSLINQIGTVEYTDLTYE